MKSFESLTQRPPIEIRLLEEFEAGILMFEPGVRVGNRDTDL